MSKSEADRRPQNDGVVNWIPQAISTVLELCKEFTRPEAGPSMKVWLGILCLSTGFTDPVTGLYGYSVLSTSCHNVCVFRNRNCVACENARLPSHCTNVQPFNVQHSLAAPEAGIFRLQGPSMSVVSCWSFHCHYISHYIYLLLNTGNPPSHFQVQEKIDASLPHHYTAVARKSCLNDNPSTVFIKFSGLTQNATRQRCHQC